MKKTTTVTLHAFAADPINAEPLYRKNNQRWYPEDRRLFWRRALSAHPHDALKETAERLIEFMHENDLIRYDYILSDYFRLYEDCNYDCNTSLKEYTIYSIAEGYNCWLDDAEGDEADELREAVKAAEEVWYWYELMTYCVECADYEYGFIEKVVNEANY